MRRAIAFAAALVLVIAACGDGGAGTATVDTNEPSVATEAPTTTGAPTTSEVPTTAAPSTTEGDSRLGAPGGREFEELRDNTVRTYPPGRYRANQVTPIPHFTIEHDWMVSDFLFVEPDNSGFSGLKPLDLAQQNGSGADPFVGIWPVTSWCDVTTDTNIVFASGEMAAAIVGDVRLTDVSVSEVAVGSCSATRIDGRVSPEYLTGIFHLGRAATRDHGDLAGCDTGNWISDSGLAGEHVVFWAVDVEGIDLLINATYPPELADEFEPMLENLVDSIEFEPAPGN